MPKLEEFGEHGNGGTVMSDMSLFFSCHNMWSDIMCECSKGKKKTVYLGGRNDKFKDVEN